MRHFLYILNRSKRWIIGIAAVKHLQVSHILSIISEVCLRTDLNKKVPLSVSLVFI